MSNAETTHCLDIRNLTVRIGDAEILSDVSMHLHSGEVTAVIGPNGAGKSTLLKAILGLVPYTGTIAFHTHRGETRTTPRIGYVPQRMDFDRSAPMTVLDFFAISAQRRPVVFGHARAVRESARQHLARMGADHLMRRPLGKLSGGEFQRVLLALALRNAPDILLLDEPVSGMDVAGAELFCDILDEIHRSAQFSLLLVSHDLSVVMRHAGRVVCLNRRIVCQGATARMLSADTIAAIYGHGAHLIQHNFADGHGHIHG